MNDPTVKACAVMIAGVAFATIEGSRAAIVAGYAIAIIAALTMAFRCRAPSRRRP